jgi:hypothetical protein
MLSGDFRGYVLFFVADGTVRSIERVLNGDNPLGISFIAIAGTVSLRQSPPLRNQLCARTLKRFNVLLGHEFSFCDGLLF